MGNVCQIDIARHNLGEHPGSPVPSCESLLAEVVAPDETGVHLLPYGEINGVGLGARARVARGYDRVCPGPG